MNFIVNDDEFNESSQSHSKMDREWVSDKWSEFSTPKNNKDNGKWWSSELNTAKINRSKYKGRKIYHHGNKIKFSNSSTLKNNSSHPSASKFYSEIVHEIEEEKHDECFFGHLEADDQQYE